MKRSVLEVVGIAIAATVLWTGAADAQLPLSFVAGPTFANLTGDDAPDPSESKTGFFVAAGTGIPINETFMIEGYVGYMQKGAQEEGGDGELTLDYVEIPILLSAMFPLTETVGLNVSAGPSIAFNLKCEFDGEDCSDEENFNSTDFGIMAGAGLGFPLTGNVAAFVGAGADFGFSDIEEGEDVKNRVYFLFAGINVPIGGAP
jgi:hypothetical protein